MNKVFPLGIDGGNWNLIKRWLDDGELLNLKKLVEESVTATHNLKTVEEMLNKKSPFDGNTAKRIAEVIKNAGIN